MFSCIACKWIVLGANDVNKNPSVSLFCFMFFIFYNGELLICYDCDLAMLCYVMFHLGVTETSTFTPPCLIWL